MFVHHTHLTVSSCLNVMLACQDFLAQGVGVPVPNLMTISNFSFVSFMNYVNLLINYKGYKNYNKNKKLINFKKMINSALVFNFISLGYIIGTFKLIKKFSLD